MRARSKPQERMEMSFIKIHLGKGMEDVRDQVEQMMDNMLHLRRCFASGSGACWAPPTDIYETQEEILLLMEAAGLKAEEIQVVFDQGVLWVSGTRVSPMRDPERSFHQMEIDFGPFERRVRIRVDIDPDRIQAVYREGFLIIHLTKAAQVDREIPVKTEE
jgi:HSP20 family protein